MKYLTQSGNVVVITTKNYKRKCVDCGSWSHRTAKYNIENSFYCPRCMREILREKYESSIRSYEQLFNHNFNGEWYSFTTPSMYCNLLNKINKKISRRNKIVYKSSVKLNSILEW